MKVAFIFTVDHAVHTSTLQIHAEVEWYANPLVQQDNDMTTLWSGSKLNFYWCDDQLKVKTLGGKVRT